MRGSPNDRLLRVKLQHAESELADARALIADLHDQLTRANQAAVRLARRQYRAPLIVARAA